LVAAGASFGACGDRAAIAGKSFLADGFAGKSISSSSDGAGGARGGPFPGTVGGSIGFLGDAATGKSASRSPMLGSCGFDGSGFFTGGKTGFANFAPTAGRSSSDGVIAGRGGGCFAATGFATGGAGFAIGDGRSGRVAFCWAARVATNPGAFVAGRSAFCFPAGFAAGSPAFAGPAALGKSANGSSASGEPDGRFGDESGAEGDAPGRGAPGLIGSTIAAPPSSFTMNVCPHFGQRIFKPFGGILRSST
jgi:hypothetical protein